MIGILTPDIACHTIFAQNFGQKKNYDCFIINGYAFAMNKICD